MISARTSNQLHPPRKKRGVELNKKCTVIRKSGGTTATIFTGTDTACTVFIDSLYSNAEKLGGTLYGKYIKIGHEIKG